MASSYPAGLVAFKLACQLSPVIFTNGIAQGFPFNMLPIIVFTEAANFPLGVLSGQSPVDLDSYFANFQPLSGATLIDNQYGTYPLGSQQVAANAVIVQPLRVSLSMLVPARQPLGYTAKSLTLYALQAAVSSHVSQGGTFTVVTPSYIYTNCLLLALRDISGGATKQSQYEWAWDFFQPLLTANQIQQSQSSLMSQITSAATGSSNPGWSGLSTATPQSGSGAGLLPSSTSLTGSSAGQSIPNQ
jgi:hypothetical protein